MKSAKTAFTFLTLTAALFGTIMPIMADTFIGPTTPENHFMIGTNEAVLIDTLIGSNAAVDSLVISNVTYPSPIPIGLSSLCTASVIPIAIPGPAEVIVGNPCIIHYTTLTNCPMQMIQWSTPNATNTITITVPAGETIQFFTAPWVTGPWVPGSGYGISATAYSGSASFPIGIINGSEFDGPITLTFNPPSSTPYFIASYWFVQNIFQNPNGVMVSGSPNVILQKSADLKSWQPVATFPLTLGSNGFYRLQVSQ